MSISLIVSGVGALVLAAAYVMLLLRAARAPRGDLIAWSVALLGLVISLGSQAIGHDQGFTAATFRGMEVGAGVLAPLALIMGLSEAVARSGAGRFAARLLIPAFAIIPLYVFLMDPLSGTAFTTAWPSPAVYYQFIPNKLAEFGVAPITIIVAIVTVGIAIRRSGREFAWRAALGPVTAAGVAVLGLAVPGLAPAIRDHLGVRVPLDSLFSVLCVIAGVLTWYAGVRIASVPADALRDGSLRAPGRPPDDYERPAYDRAARPARPPYEQPPYEPPPPASVRDFDSEAFDSEAFDSAGHDSMRDPEPAVAARDGRAPGAAGRSPAVDETGDIEAIDPAVMQALRRGLPEDDRNYPAYNGPRTGEFAAAEAAPAPKATPAPAPKAPAGASREALFGQIAIYTLIEDQVEEFDRLTERVVGQVRASEPNTLVFIVHAVPTAPMQRILYEVYRDRAAYDWHLQQPYVSRFEDERRPYVLATNVIELGLQHAKVSPFASVSELLGEPAYDTSGFERPDFTREYGSTVRGESA